MDKYIRNDDVNDDLGVYRHDEDLLQNGDIHTVFKSHTPNQRIRVKNKEVDDNGKDYERKTNKALSILSEQETILWERIKRGQSIKQAARLMGIKQQTAQIYWERIKEKLA